jgi:hypothetical protein
VFFEPNDNNLTIWEQQIQILLGVGTKDTDKPGKEYFHRDEPDASLWTTEVTDPLLIEHIKRKWFDKIWLHRPAPAVETEDYFPMPAPEVTDPAVTKELVYSLAKEYYEKFPEHIK